jgi:hypothetical protein
MAAWRARKELHQHGAISIALYAAPQYACCIAAFKRIKFCRFPGHIAGVSKNFSASHFHALLYAMQQFGAHHCRTTLPRSSSPQKFVNCLDDLCVLNVGMTQQYPRQ